MFAQLERTLVHVESPLSLVLIYHSIGPARKLRMDSDEASVKKEITVRNLEFGNEPSMAYYCISKG